VPKSTGLFFSTHGSTQIRLEATLPPYSNVSEDAGEVVAKVKNSSEPGIAPRAFHAEVVQVMVG